MTEEEVKALIRQELYDVVQDVIKEKETRQRLGPSPDYQEPDPLEALLKALSQRMRK